MEAAELTYDNNGNTILDQNGLTFVYDAWNRQVEVKNGATSLVRYAFDGLNRRVEAGSTEVYYTASWQGIEERVSGDVTVQYVMSPVYVDAYILRDRDTNPLAGGLEERLYVLQDANFNVTAIADDGGTVVERFVFDTYGARTVLEEDWDPVADAYVFLPGHQGGKIDPVSGKMHFRNREYDVETMRWMQQDPMGYVDGANVYQYGRSSPYFWSDAHGLEVKAATKPVLHLDEEISALDATTTGKPYSESAAAWREDTAEAHAERLKILQMQIPAFTKAGSYELTNKALGNGQIPAGLWGLAMRLFYVSVPICETNPGEAYVVVNEKWKQEMWQDGQWKDVTPANKRDFDAIADFPSPQDKMPGRSRNLRIAPLKDALPGNPPHDKVIILADLPNIDSVLKDFGDLKKAFQKLTVTQTFILKDKSQNWKEITRLEHTFTVGFDQTGKIIDSPPTTQPAT